MLSFGANATTVSLTEELISEAIMDNALDYDPESKLKIRITKGKDKLEEFISEDIVLTDIEIDTSKGRFAGIMIIDNKIEHEISGKYTEIVKIPAINTKLRRNEVITAAHITYVDIDKSKLSRGYIDDELQLIGKSPVRTLFKNRPVMPKQIAAPTIIDRKESVTMVFENNIMQIQDVGVAVEEGGMGDMIRVRNVNSNVIVHARIIGDNLVKVTGANRMMASNF